MGIAAPLFCDKSENHFMIQLHCLCRGKVFRGQNHRFLQIRHTVSDTFQNFRQPCGNTADICIPCLHIGIIHL